MKSKKPSVLPETYGLDLKTKQRSTKSTASNTSMTLAKQWLMRFSEKHAGSDEQFERWMNK